MTIIRTGGFATGYSYETTSNPNIHTYYTYIIYNTEELNWIFVTGNISFTKGYAMMSIGEELKSTMPSFIQFCSRVDQGNVQEDWWTAGSDAGNDLFNHFFYNITCTYIMMLDVD